MSTRSLLVVSVDGLRASALGAYGNTTYPTPTFDRLASQSVVYDHYVVDSADAGLVATALWTGRHAHHPAPSGQEPSLAKLLQQQGICCRRVTDDPHLANLPSAADWEEVILVSPPDHTRATDAASTAMGGLLATALEVAADLASQAIPALLWIHLSGMWAPWDAPPEFALSLRDEQQDPDWQPTSEIPHHPDSPPADDDQIFIANCRYAGQVMALDDCLAGFCAELAGPTHAGRWDLILMGLRGFPLGEHGAIGEPVPYNEQFHVPLYYHRADGTHQLTRQSGLIQPSDLYAWLAELPQHNSPLIPHRNVALSTAAGRQAIATSQWRGVTAKSGADQMEFELYVGTDDRWQANNVASRCPEEVEELNNLLHQLQQAEE